MMEATPLISSKRAPRLLLERQLALKEPGVGKSAHLIKDAVIGHRDAPYEGYYDPYENEARPWRNWISIVCGRLVVKLRWAVIFCSWVLFMLTFFEPPHWCRDASHLDIIDKPEHDPAYINDNALKGYGNCKLLLNLYGTTADNEENEQLYPNSGTMWLTIRQSKQIELACVCFVSLYLTFAFADDGFVPSLFFYPGYKRRIHAVQCIVLLCLFITAKYETTIHNPFLRMLVLGSFLRSFQRELWTFLKMIPEMMVPLSMVAVIVLFYAWFGVVIFYDLPEGTAAFPNLAEGMWTLWICITTANYPDVMMPAYNENRGVAFYFISFMVISFFYMMNLVLAVACNSYDENIEKRKSDRSKLARDSLLEAFELLDNNGENSVCRKSIMHVMTILNQDIPEIQGLSQEEKSIMFAFLDHDGDGSISRDEFLDFGSVLLLNLEKKSNYATFVETNLPSVFESSFYQALSKSVKSKSFERAVEVVLVLNALIIATQDYPMLVGQDSTATSLHLEGAETIFTLVYVIEAMLKIMVNGWKQYIESPKNCFDFLITVLVVVASAYVYYPNAYNDPTIIHFIVMVRVLRLGRLLFTVEKFRLFGFISIEIIPAATNVFTVLLFIGYLFASLGMLLYGGIITRDPLNPVSELLLESEDFVEGAYWANNFNDMFSGMNVLFNWIVVNNWTTQASGMEHATGAKWFVRLYFFAFYLLGVIGISNVITSFIINAFFQQLQTIESRQGPEEEIEGEAVLRGSHAVFDSSLVTGTETGLRNTVFFARLRARHTDVELDERQVLKKLFSRDSNISSREEH